MKKAILSFSFLLAVNVQASPLCSLDFLKQHESAMTQLLSPFLEKSPELAITLKEFLSSSEAAEGEADKYTYRFSCWYNNTLEVAVEDEVTYCEYSAGEGRNGWYEYHECFAKE